MSKKLLLADDSITIQKVIGITFANEDYELAIVDNGDDALEKAQEIRPDLILADILMPGRNGYELCAAIKQDPALAGIPVLLLTGTFEPFDEEKARTSGADSWIAKPFESQALIEKVEALLAAAPAAEAGAAPETPAEQEPAAEVAVAEPERETAGEPLSDEDIWGDLDLDEGEAAPAAAAAPGFAQSEPEADEALVEEEDPWGDISFDEEDLQGTPPRPTPATPAETAGAGEDEEFIFEDEEEGFLIEEESALTAEAETGPQGAASDWEEFEDDILPLDESDILEAEELSEDVQEPLSAGDEAPAGEDEALIFDEQALALEEEAEDFVFTEETPEEEGGPAVQTPGAEEFIFEGDDEQDVATEAPGVGRGQDFEEAFTETDVVDQGGVDEIQWDFGEEEAPSLETEPQPAPDLEPSLPAGEVGSEAEPEPEVEPEAWGEVEAEEAPVQAPPAAAAEQQAETAARGLSEEELERIVEKVAGAVVERMANSVLEKVAWEVVPDLAEAMVRDELRKIREQAV